MNHLESVLGEDSDKRLTARLRRHHLSPLSVSYFLSANRPRHGGHESGEEGESWLSYPRPVSDEKSRGVPQCMSTSVETGDKVQALHELLDRFAERHQADILPPHNTERMLTLLAKHDDKPPESKRVLRHWMEKEPDSFWPVAFWVMRYGSDPSVPAAIKAALRVPDDLIAPLLDHRAFSRQDATELAQELGCFRPMLEVSLLQRVFDAGKDEASLRRLLRALDIVGTITEGDRIRHQLVILRRIRDPRVQSKLTLILARRVRDTEWLEQQFEDPDPRVRANVVEGLWDAADSEEKKALLWRATHDPHNRVLGNALVGLVRMEDVEGVLDARVDG